MSGLLVTRRLDAYWKNIAGIGTMSHKEHYYMQEYQETCARSNIAKRIQYGSMVPRNK